MKQEWPSYQELQELERDRTSEEFKMMVHRIKEFLLLSENHPEEQTLPEETWRRKIIPDDWEEKEGSLQEAISAKWNRLYHWKHPDAGTAFSYEEWKDGWTGNAIIKWRNRSSPGEVPPGPDHDFYSISLQKAFREKGLQIIVKLTSIELTPDNPSYQGGGWHIEGTLNEHVVATAVYYYDVGNVTDSRLSFRQDTKLDEDDFVCVREHFEQLVKVFAIPDEGRLAPARQELGSVSTSEGCLLTWPNTLHHRVEPFKLADPSKLGHRRFVVLWLVDPYYRICSTKNVPPQRHDWWAEEALASTAFAEKGMLQEILEMIDRETGECQWVWKRQGN